mgnify:CR=1 FL=1
MFIFPIRLLIHTRYVFVYDQYDIILIVFAILISLQIDKQKNNIKYDENKQNKKTSSRIVKRLLNELQLWIKKYIDLVIKKNVMKSLLRFRLNICGMNMRLHFMMQQL